MENTTRLLHRQEAALSGRHVFVVEANDSALAMLPGPASVTIHSDDFSISADQWALAPSIPVATDLLIVPLPKSIERLRFLLQWLAGQCSSTCELWLLGPAKGGIKGALKHLQACCDTVDLLDSARHCKLYSGQLQPAAPQPLSQWAQPFTMTDISLLSYPGVFSHGRLDEGSALLLDALAGLTLTPGAGLDLGCGAGVLSVFLARRGWNMQAVDVSASAVAASDANFAALLSPAGVAGTATAAGSDLFSAVSGRFDLLVSNPPFHEGRQRTMAVTRRLIEGASQHLGAQGELWLVANRELPYAQWLDDHFGRVTVVSESNRFKVYRAQR